ncbi:Tethering factor for nuclear proteasome sts1, partial [Linderina pennispora]
PKDVTLDKLLEPLEEKDLRSLLDMLITQNPGLATQVRDLVPKPTVNSACSQLVRLERRLLAAFPYNKSGPLADDYTYHRVKPALEELRDTIVMYLDHFTHYGLVSSRSTAAVQTDNVLTHPAEWFDLLAQATDIAMRMPKWDRREHNEIRRDTLRLLADGWLRAIMATARWSEEGHIMGRDMVSQWGYQLDHFYQNSGEPSLFQPPMQVFQQSFGQYCGLVTRGVSSHLPVETAPVPSL